MVDVLVIGAGAAGLMCAMTAGRRGRSVAILDHGRAPGEKIRISGGGRCNFTNINTAPANFLSTNPHFAKSALSRYTPADFVALVDSHGIAWHEKTLGQLFCDGSARQIVDMLLSEIRAAGVQLQLSRPIVAVERREAGFRVETDDGSWHCASLVVATGGKSIPKMGATGYAYRLAEQFGLPLVETRPGLVPLTLDPLLLESLAPLSGISVPAELVHGRTRFREALLFTHRGLSGPAVLQISSYWREGDEIALRLEPERDILEALKQAKHRNGRQLPVTALAELLPKRLAQFLVQKPDEAADLDRAIADLSDKRLARLASAVQDWRIKPSGSEGYRTAEVTLGGIDTSALSSRDMQVRHIPGLYFIGECVDVTGWLGGYNFQWAWASGFAAGQTA